MIAKATPRSLPQEGFTGFRPEGFTFLRDLAQHQTRDFFEANRDVYDGELRLPMASLVLGLSEELLRRKIPLRGDPKRSVFRIHRDLRFSKDKRPYKTHVGAVLTKSGDKVIHEGVLYVHIDPLGSFVAVGFHRPEPGPLTALRSAIRDRAAAYRRMSKKLAANRLTLSDDEAPLSRAPRGFETVTAKDLAEAVRHRSFLVEKPLAKKAVGSPGLVTDLADFAETALPLLEFGWVAFR